MVRFRVPRQRSTNASSLGPAPGHAMNGARSFLSTGSYVNGCSAADSSRKKSNGLYTDISATRSTSMSSSVVGSGKTTRAR